MKRPAIVPARGDDVPHVLLPRPTRLPTVAQTAQTLALPPGAWMRSDDEGATVRPGAGCAS